MLREGSTLDHFRNRKTSHLLSFDKTHNVLRFNTHIILISFSIQPVTPLLSLFPPATWRNAAFRVIRRRTSTASRPSQMCGKFRRSHQNFEAVNFSRHFAALFGHFVIFAWATLKNLSFDSAEEGEKPWERWRKKLQGVGDKHQMRQQKSFSFFSLNYPN